MIPMFLDPVEHVQGIGMITQVAPWSVANPSVHTDRELFLALDTRMLRAAGSALLVELPYGWRLNVSPCVFPSPGKDTLPMGLTPCGTDERPVVHVSIHAHVLDTPASPWL